MGPGHAAGPRLGAAAEEGRLVQEGSGWKTRGSGRFQLLAVKYVMRQKSTSVGGLEVNSTLRTSNYRERQAVH